MFDYRISKHPLSMKPAEPSPASQHSEAGGTCRHERTNPKLNPEQPHQLTAPDI